MSNQLEPLFLNDNHSLLACVLFGVNIFGGCFGDFAKEDKELV
jgi:hypothetical protein